MFIVEQLGGDRNDQLSVSKEGILMDVVNTVINPSPCSPSLFQCLLEW